MGFKAGWPKALNLSLWLVKEVLLLGIGSQAVVQVISRLLGNSPGSHTKLFPRFLEPSPSSL